MNAWIRQMLMMAVGMAGDQADQRDVIKNALLGEPVSLDITPEVAEILEDAIIKRGKELAEQGIGKL